MTPPSRRARPCCRRGERAPPRPTAAAVPPSRAAAAWPPRKRPGRAESAAASTRAPAPSRRPGGPAQTRPGRMQRQGGAPRPQRNRDCPRRGQVLPLGGEGGIRTPDRGISPYNRLAICPVRPLQHLSAVAAHCVGGLAGALAARSDHVATDPPVVARRDYHEPRPVRAATGSVGRRGALRRCGRSPGGRRRPCPCTRRASP